MANDRRLSLIRQAQVEGFIDCSRAQPSDRNWWYQLDLTLDWIEARNRNEIRKLKHDINCALLTYMAGERALELHWEQAHELQRNYAKTIIPWQTFEKARFSRQVFHEMVDLWKQAFGDPADKSVQDKINKTVNFLLSRTNND